jgi:hypothetical protein
VITVYFNLKMTEVVDLTFTDSDDEPQPRTSLPPPPPPPPATTGAGGMRTPLRHLLALQQRRNGGGSLAAAQPPSPEAIELLKSPEPTRPQHDYRQPGPLKQRQIEREVEEEAPATVAAPQNLAEPSRPPRNTTYDPTDYVNQFAEEMYEPDFLPGNNPTKVATTAGGGGGKKPKRTREEIARDKELKKQQK